MLDTDEVMLAPWVVVVVERIESLDLLDDRISHRVFKCGYSGRHHDAAAPEGLPEGIVQGAYLRPSCVPIFAFLYQSYALLTSVALPANHSLAGARDRGSPASVSQRFC